MMSARSTRLAAIGALTVILLATACSVSVTSEDGVLTATVKIANRAFKFTLGTVGQFECPADGSSVQTAAEIPLFDEVASDTPTSAAIAIDLGTVQAIPLGTTKASTTSQTITGSADVLLRIASATSMNPCVDGVAVGTFRMTFADGTISMDQTSLELPPEALAHAITGRFTICLEVTANVDLMLTIGAMSVIFGPPAENENDNAGGEQEDQGEGEDEAGGSCLSDADCPAGESCDAGECVSDDATEEQQKSTVAGNVVDAQTGEPLSGVVVQVSDTSLSATTDASGEFTILDAPVGAVTLVASLTGYVETSVPVLVLAGITAETSIGMLALGAGGDHVAVVLAWGQEPRDLDLHMSGPDGSDARFHIAFYNSTPVDFAFLDLDDTDSFGPETITISPRTDGTFVPGDYHVWIHHYAGDLTFAESSATVTLFAGGAQTAQYSVGSASGDTSQRIWQVVEFDVSQTGAVSNIRLLQSFTDGESSSEF